MSFVLCLFCVAASVSAQKLNIVFSPKLDPGETSVQATATFKTYAVAALGVPDASVKQSLFVVDSSGRQGPFDETRFLQLSSKTQEPVFAARIGDAWTVRNGKASFGPCRRVEKLCAGWDEYQCVYLAQASAAEPPRVYVNGVACDPPAVDAAVSRDLYLHTDSRKDTNMFFSGQSPDGTWELRSAFTVFLTRNEEISQAAMFKFKPLYAAKPAPGSGLDLEKFFIFFDKKPISAGYDEVADIMFADNDLAAVCRTGEDRYIITAAGTFTP